MQFLFEANFGGVVPNQSELLHHEEEVPFGRLSAPARARIEGANRTGDGEFLVQFPQDFRLLLFRALHKVLTEPVLAPAVHIRQPGEKTAALLFVIPLGENQIDEFIDASRFCSRRIRLRDDQLGDRGNGSILVRVERF